MTAPKCYKVIKNTMEPLSNHVIICDESNTIVKEALYKKTSRYSSVNAFPTLMNQMEDSAGACD